MNRSFEQMIAAGYRTLPPDLEEVEACPTWWVARTTLGRPGFYEEDPVVLELEVINEEIYFSVGKSPLDGLGYEHLEENLAVRWDMRKALWAPCKPP